MVVKIKKKGSFLIEILIVLGITFLILNFLFIKYNNIKENQDLDKAINIFETVVYKYTVKSLSSKKNFNFHFDYNSKKITIISDDKKKNIKTINLPKKLKYATLYNNMNLRKFNFSTKTNGNLTKSFSTYIFNYSDEMIYRISYYIFQQSHILKINVYKNINKKKLKYKNLENLTLEEGETTKHWIKL